MKDEVRNVKAPLHESSLILVCTSVQEFQLLVKRKMRRRRKKKRGEGGGSREEEVKPKRRSRTKGVREKEESR